MMNARTIVAASILAAGLAVWPGATAIRAQDPGTVGDPLITRSYLDQFFRFRSMVIQGGEKVELAAGALLVLRSGRLKFQGGKGRNLIDLTAGAEIAPGTFIPAHHLVLVPDGVGCAVEAQSATMLLAMGLHPAHSIQPAQPTPAAPAAKPAPHRKP